MYNERANEPGRNCTYSLTLNTFLCVSQADVLEDSLLAVVQVLGLGQQDAASLCIFTDDVVGLAHTLSSRLVHKIHNQFKSFVELCGRNSMKISICTSCSS